MKDILEFLKNAGVYFLATMDGDQPRVRPIGFVMDCGGKLAFCTGNKKNMCEQLKINPKVEIACYDGKGNTLRISGKAIFATSEASQRMAMDAMPSLSHMYSVGDGVFEVYYLDEAKAACYNMNGDCKEIAI